MIMNGTDENNKTIQPMSSPTSILLQPMAGHETKEQQDNLAGDSDNRHLLLNDTFQLTPSSYQINLDTFINMIPNTIRTLDISGHQSIVSGNDPVASLFRYATLITSSFSSTTLLTRSSYLTENKS